MLKKGMIMEKIGVQRKWQGFDFGIWSEGVKAARGIIHSGHYGGGVVLGRGMYWWIIWENSIWILWKSKKP
jgi:hypothetical protein